MRDVQCDVYAMCAQIARNARVCLCRCVQDRERQETESTDDPRDRDYRETETRDMRALL